MLILVLVTECVRNWHVWLIWQWKISISKGKKMYLWWYYLFSPGLQPSVLGVGNCTSIVRCYQWPGGAAVAGLTQLVHSSRSCSLNTMLALHDHNCGKFMSVSMSITRPFWWSCRASRILWQGSSGCDRCHLPAPVPLHLRLCQLLHSLTWLTVVHLWNVFMIWVGMKC